MREVTGDIWAHADAAGGWVTITTNGALNRAGELVMGAGIAGEAKRRMPTLPAVLADHVAEHGNVPAVIASARVITWPTKADQHTIDGVTHPGWMCAAKMRHPSCNRVVAHTTWRNGPLFRDAAAAVASMQSPVFVPKVGCGLGGLDWDKVRPWLHDLLDDRFIAVI